MSLLLPAADPVEWVQTHLGAHYDQYGAVDPGDDSYDSRWYGVQQLLADDGAVLRSVHARLMADDKLPARGAATYLAGWTGGALADAIGFGLAMAGAGFIVDPRSTRWHLSTGGWTDRIDLGEAGVVVPADHPWAGTSGVQTVGDAQVARELAVDALVEAVVPLIDLCHSMARVGKAGLWNEVGDALGMAAAFQPAVPVERAVCDSLAAAVRTSGVPWRARAKLQIAEGVTGPVYVAQKGGCCLAYTRPAAPANPEELDELERNYLRRFPETADSRHYCSTCSLRDFDDCRARQLFWIECVQRASATASS